LAQVFISYSRTDKDFVHKIGEALAEQKREAWVDWHDIPPTAEWLKEVYAGIEAADNFVFVISPEAVASVTCLKEIAYASANAKRMIPILHREVPDSAIPGALAGIHWIFFRGTDDFETAFASLIEALDTDLGWKREHTRLLVRAKEWERSKKEDSFLLRGKDLREAEQWLTKSVEKQSATSLHSRYILSSRQAATRLQRIIIGAVVVAFLIAVGLAIYAFRQKNLAQREQSFANAKAIEAQIEKQAADDNAAEATRQKNTAVKNEVEARTEARAALSEGLAATSLARETIDVDIAGLLAIQSHALSDTYQSRNALGLLWEDTQGIQRIFSFTSSVSAIHYSDTLGGAVVADKNGFLTLWPFNNARPIIIGHRDVPIRTMAVSHSGIIAACGYSDGEVAFWDLKQRKAISVSQAIQGLFPIAFSFDDGLLVLITLKSNDRHVRFWDMRANHFIDLSPSSNLRPHGVSSNRNRMIALSTWNGTDIYSVPSGNLLKSLPGVIRATFNDDGTLLAGATENQITFFDTSTWEPLPGRIDALEVAEMAFSPGGLLFAWGLSSGDLHVAAYPITEDRQWLYKVNHFAITNVTFTADSKEIFWSGADGIGIRAKAEPWIMSQKRSFRGEALIDDVHGHLIVLDHSKMLDVYELNQGRRVATLADTDNIDRDAFSHSPSLALDAMHQLVSEGDVSGNVRLWSLRNNPPTIARAAVLDTVWSMAFHPDRPLLAIADNNGDLSVWRYKSGMKPSIVYGPHTPETPPTCIWVVRFSPDGTLLAAGDDDGVIRFWSSGSFLMSGVPLTIAGSDPASVRALAFSGDGQILAAGYANGDVRLWDVSSRTPLARLSNGHSDIVRALAFSDDGHILASGSDDKTVRLWDVNAQQPLGHPLSVDSGVEYMTFGSEGVLYVLEKSGRLLGWVVKPDAWAGDLCNMIGRDLTNDERKLYFAGIAVPPSLCAAPKR
jgi:WD40 repeat protein/type II secretory pathway component PulM